MKRILLTALLIIFLTGPLLRCQGRPEEMRYLADLLRGWWVGTEQQPETPLQLEMRGYWTLGGHFLELELTAKREGEIVDIEKLIFGWDCAEKAYRCWYFNSKGERKESLWRLQQDNFIVEVSKPNNSLKLEREGSMLLFSFNGKLRTYHLKQR